MFFRELETERLWLRNISAADRDFVFKEFSDAAVNEYLYDAEPAACLEDADDIIGMFIMPEPRGQHRWIITLKATGERIGTCGFHCLDGADVDVGYDMQSAYWGKGIMSEALRAIIAFAEENMAVERIYAHISVDNKRSVALAERLGFVKSGETEILHFHGKDYLHDIYVLNCK